MSLSICVHEYRHTDLRKSISEQIIVCALSDGLLESGLAAAYERASAMAQEAFWAGEDIMPVAAASLQRDVHVHVENVKDSPLIYSSGPSVLQPVLLALYGPGHYKAVVSRDTGCSGRSDSQPSFRSRDNYEPSNTQPALFPSGNWVAPVGLVMHLGGYYCTSTRDLLKVSLTKWRQKLFFTDQPLCA